MFKSTPTSRMRKRDNAAKIGKAQEILTSQPFLISGVAVSFLAVGFIEKLSF